MSTSLVSGTVVTRQSPIVARPDVIFSIYHPSPLTRAILLLNPVCALTPHPLLFLALLTSPHSYSSCPRLDHSFRTRTFCAPLTPPRLDSRAGLVWPPPDQESHRCSTRLQAPQPFMQLCLTWIHYVSRSFFLFRTQRALPFSTQHT